MKIKKEFGKTSESIEGYCFVIFVIGLIIPKNRKYDDKTEARMC
jgi:hypothetical protein